METGSSAEGAPLSTEGARGPSARLAYLALGVILALAIALRVNAIDRLLPHSTEPDNDVAHQVFLLESKTPPAERPGVYRRYPLLMADLARLLPKVAAPVSSTAGDSASGAAADDLDAHVRAAHDVTIRLRWISVVSSVCLVLTTWFLARRFLRPAAALIAAFFVATSLLHLLFSQQARPHALHATLASLAVLSALRVRERPTIAAHLCAGLMVGLSVACLQSGMATVLPLAAAIVFAERGGAAGVRSGRSWGKAALALALAGGVAFAFMPGETQPEFDGTTQELQLDAHRLRFGGHEVVFSELDGSGFVRMGRFLWDHDPMLLVAAVLGFFVLLPRRRSVWNDKNLRVVLAYALPYALAIGIYRQTFDRFLLPLLPYVACLAAVGVERAITWSASLPAKMKRDAPRDGIGASRRLSRVLAIAVAVLFLALPSLAALQFARVCRARDTFERASDWLATHVTGDERILVTPGIILPLFYHPESIQRVKVRLPPEWYAYTRWLSYQAGLPPAAWHGPRFRIFDVPISPTYSEPAEIPEVGEQFLEKVAPRYVLIETSLRTSYWAGAQAIAQRVRERGKLVWSIDGELPNGPEQRPFAYQDIVRTVPRLFRLQQLGPRLEIYRMP